MGYKEFVKLEMERASKNDWFDPNGNNVIATANRSFIAELKTQVGRFNSDIVSAINLNELAIQLINVVMVISIPVTYIPMIIARTYFTKKRAKKEMLEDYKKKKAG